MSEFVPQNTIGSGFSVVPTFAIGYAPALDAEPMTLFGQVRGDVQMPVWAVRLSPLSGRAGRSSQAPAHIFLMGNGLKVGRPNASTNAAEVVEVASVRNGADHHLVGKAVSADEFRLTAGEMLPVEEGAVTEVVTGADPQGTAVNPAGIDFRPEAFFEGEALPLTERIAVSLPSPVVHIAPAAHDKLSVAACHGTKGLGMLPEHLNFLSGVTEPGADTSRLHSILLRGGAA